MRHSDEIGQDFRVETTKGSYLVRDHSRNRNPQVRGYAVVPPYSPGPPDYWADTAEEATEWCYRDAAPKRVKKEIDQLNAIWELPSE